MSDQATLLPRYPSQGADLDPTRTYRYDLHRTLAPGGTTVLWVMLNPSTADEDVLDPTLRKCEQFTRRWGYGGFRVANLFALRATDKRRLLTHPDPVGPRNDDAIRAACWSASLVVVGFGTIWHPLVACRAAYVGRLLQERRALWCLGTNADGSPRHPLYLPYTAPRQPWELPT